MRKSILASLVVGCLGLLLSGCNVGMVSEAQQQAKVKAMDDVAKTDPRFAWKQSHGRRQ